MAEAKDDVELRRNKSDVKPGLFSGLTDEDVEKYHEAFTVWDKNRSGRISMLELEELLKNLGKDQPSQAELQEIMEELDETNSGGIDFAQFLIFMTRQSGPKDDGDELREAFAIMDTDNDGHISSEDLEKVLRRLGFNFAEDEIEEMIKVADKTGQGSVNIEEFLSVMRS